MISRHVIRSLALATAVHACTVPLPLSAAEADEAAGTRRNLTQEGRLRTLHGAVASPDGRNAAGAAELDLQPSDVDSLSSIAAKVIEARSHGDRPGALELIEAAMPSAGAHQRALLQLWQADDLSVVEGADAALEALQPLLAGKVPGRIFERHWEHQALITGADALAREGRIAEAAAFQQRIAAAFPDECDPFLMWETAEAMHLFGAEGASGPESPLHLALAAASKPGALVYRSPALDPVPIVRAPYPGTTPLDAATLLRLPVAGKVLVGREGGLGLAVAGEDIARVLATMSREVAKATFIGESDTDVSLWNIQEPGSRGRKVILGVRDGVLELVVGVEWPIDVQPLYSATEAWNGYQAPFASNQNGYCFLQWSSASGCYHPGWDMNLSGTSGDGDCGTSVRAVSNGTIRYAVARPSSWGSLVQETRWQGTTTYAQSGHCSDVWVSVGMTVTKGQAIAAVGKVGTTVCHLHQEMRETDHPNPTYAPYWSTNSFQTQKQVLFWYDDPALLWAGHPAYDSNSTIVLDDFAADGTSGGPSSYWNFSVETLCSANPSSTFTYANGGTTSNWHEWKIRSLARRRTLRVYAKIPSSATSTAVPYQLTVNGALVRRTVVNQYSNRGGWVSLGSVTANAGQSVSCQVLDSTGEAVGSRKIGVDVVEFRN